MKLAQQPLQHALKEWAIAVDALSAGETIILLRKGGIREAGFQVKFPLVWLYPTYEHQKPDLLKPQYADRVVPVESGWHPETVKIQSCGSITDVLPISSIAQVKALQPYHIWTEEAIGDRLSWKPQKPLTVLLLRVYCLATPQIIPYSDTYGGCKSWIDLIEPIAGDRLTPVIEDRQYEGQVTAIKASLEAVS